MLDFQFRLLGILIWHAQEGIEHLLLRRLGNKHGLLGKASTKLSLVVIETLSYLTKVLKKCPSRVEQLDSNGWHPESPLLAIFCCIECSGLRR